MGSIQLGFGRGFVRSGQWGVAQGGVAQTADCTVYAVDADRLATVLTDFDGFGKFQLYAAFNGVADNIAVAFDVDCVAQTVFVAVARTTDIDAFGNIAGVGIGFLINFVQLRPVNSISTVSSKRAFGNLSNLVTAVVQTGGGQRHLVRRTVRTDLQTVGSQYAVACNNAVGNYAGSFHGSSFDIGKLNVV